MQMSIVLLKDRLCESLGHSGAVKRPFNVIDVIAEQRPMQQQQPAAMIPTADTVQPSLGGQPRSRTTSATYYQVSKHCASSSSVYHCHHC